MVRVRRAILSVSDKAGLVDFAKGLHDLGVDLLASDGTAKVLRNHGVAATPVAHVTGQEELLGGRVKTLHPRIHAALLARDEDREVLAALGVEPIDLAVVNLYPFEEAMRRGAPEGEAMERIDVGGVALIRSAAKNHARVAVVVRPARYPAILEALRRGDGTLDEATRRALAEEAFAYTAAYDAAIYRYFWRRRGAALPPELRMAFDRLAVLRYGENPYQEAAFYRDPFYDGVSLADAEQLHGKALSYNNILDLDAALQLALEFDEPAAVVIKHTNPSGVAVDEDLAAAYADAYACDPKAAYGSVVGLNRPVDEGTAKGMRRHFIEAVVAPDYDEAALAVLRRKRFLRIMRTGRPFERTDGLFHIAVRGGMLVQTVAFPQLGPGDLKVVTRRRPTRNEVEDMLFATKVCKHVKSNSIVLAKDRRTVGIGAGQMSRVDAVYLAGYKANERGEGSVLSSDAFFPFRDGIDAAADAGVVAIAQPGGSIRDQEVIDAADERGLAMVFTDLRLFKH
jgi:phosphoribosylaminoimidazolecarboxamide formyltransferase/IMP cyclohydrolase